MNLTPLKYLLFIENVTTVFRNYLCFKRRTRLIVLFWVFFEAFNITVVAMAKFLSENKLEDEIGNICIYSSICFSIYVIIASLYYSKRFYSLLLNFDAFYNIFEDGIYNQRMLKAQKVLTSIAVSFCVFLLIALTYDGARNSDDRMGFVATVITAYIIAMSNFRYILQYFILYCILFMVSEQLKAIIRSINGELLAAIRERESRRNVDNADSSVAVNHDKLNKWQKAYENINDSANLCTSTFSTQLSIMLLIVTVYYIILLYFIAKTTVKGDQGLMALFMNLSTMTGFLSELFMICRAGQQIQNSYMELRQKLCEFCLHTLENKEYYKLTKDLLRCVRTRPVRVHVFGTMDVNMSMLPSVVAFFTSYTVIALQSNNVL